MEKVSIIVRVYEKKAGGSFAKITIGGKYINDVLAEEDKQYQVKFTKKSLVKEPTEEGIYEVAFHDGEAWIDTRDDNKDKYIFRINAQKIKKVKPLPKLDKDVRI